MILRSVCFLFFVAVALSPQAWALRTNDVLGRWSGTRKDTAGGQVYHERTSITFTSFRSGGLKVVTRITRPGFGTLVGTSYYYPTGKVKGSATFGARKVAVAEGTWQIQGSTIREKVRVQDGNGSYRSHATMTFAGDSLSLNEKSPGSRIVGVLHR